MLALEGLVRNNCESLTDEQKSVYEEIVRSANSSEGQIFFLDAPGGTGKTYLLNLILAKIRVTRESRGVILP